MRLFIVLSTVAFVIISQGGAQEKPAPLKELDKIASDALVTFSELVTKENYQAMGFASPDEVKVATLDVPVRVFVVRLDELQKYEPGSDPSPLLSGGEHVIFPVAVEENVRSSIILEKVVEKWEVTGFGSPNLIKMITDVRKDETESTRLPAYFFFVVTVPAMNLYFVAHRIGEVLMLSPIRDEPLYGFKAGITMRADEVFEALLPAAQEHDGLPR
ncbi:MAG: hypothetical protein JSV97_03190 [candidate division WOR-3 bacterium]|nr:MAG: hypothetical protein JSV97_03190 [candidate division WOR-3 bacterium]